MFKASRRTLNRLSRLPADVQKVHLEVHRLKMLTAKVLIQEFTKPGGSHSFPEVEFQVYSQFGDDGIIQYLVHQLALAAEHQTFIEFGVEDYTEANTRFLLENNNWRGLVIDGSSANVEKIQAADYYWRFDLAAVASFITQANVNDVIRQAGFTGDIGLLHIDIDGNDYWVWQALTVVTPVIVIMEYNSVFGAQSAVTVPYDPTFNRSQKHYSNLYWGCSLRALWRLGHEKGYELIGCNTAGNNAYFVKRDALASFTPLAPQEAYRESRYRESRNKQGDLTYLNGRKRREPIAAMPLFDVEKGRLVTVKDLVLE